MSDGVIEAGFYAIMGSLIEAKRKERKMTQTEVGNMIGVHRNTIMRWESGEMRMDIWQFIRLSDALACSHLKLLPPRKFTWGVGFEEAVYERDAPLTRRQSEQERIA